MKTLKRGDFVTSKSNGRGIVLDNSTTNGINVLFENMTTSQWHVPREELFVKGDKVICKPADGWWNYKEVKTFYEPMVHNPNCDSRYTVKPKKSNKVNYCYDIRHVGVNHEQKLLDKVIDKTLTNHPISVPEISRTIYRAGQLADVGIKADKVLKKEVYAKKYKQQDLVFETFPAAVEIKGMSGHELAHYTRCISIPVEETKEQLLKRIEILELKARIEELEK